MFGKPCCAASIYLGAVILIEERRSEVLLNGSGRDMIMLTKYGKQDGDWCGEIVRVPSRSSKLEA